MDPYDPESRRVNGWHQFNENDVKDPDLMQEMDLPATFLYRATTLKFRAHLAFFLTNTQSNLYPNLVFGREFKPNK